MSDVELPTDSIAAGAETWVNTTFVAPSTGTYQIEITPDVRDEIQNPQNKANPYSSTLLSSLAWICRTMVN